MTFRRFVALSVCGLAFAAKPPAKKSAPTTRIPTSSRVAAPSQVKQWMSKLTLRQQVAQLVVVPFYGEAPAANSKAFQEFATLVRDHGVGGMIVLNRVRGGLVVNAEPYAMAAFLNRMQRLAAIPLIVGGDFERGASMRVSGTTKFPHNMAYGAANDLDGTRYLGLATARESRAMGVHWVFAPDADVNNNADNPVINLRSFGENPDLVAAHVKAYIAGAHSDPANPVLVCVKHFPGHGDTAVDSHIGLANVAGDRARLDAIELKPFRAAIAAGVDSVMTAHLTIPAVEPSEIPATISRKVMTGLLREELGFKGLLTTDAMDMYGLSKQVSPGEAAVRAIEAGVDVLLIPPQPKTAIEAVARAVESGRIGRDRLRASVERVLSAKVRLGLPQRKLVDLEKIADTIDNPEAESQAMKTAEGALTLVRNRPGLFPVTEPDRSCLFALAENRYSTLGRRFIEEVKDRAPRMSAIWLDASLPDAAFAEVAKQAATCARVYIATFATASAYRGDSGLALAVPLTRFIESLIAGPAPVGIVSFGNPYLLRNFPKAAGYVATFSTATTSEVAMGKALFGEIPFRGRLPVTIPGLAEYGTGLTAGQ